MTNSVFLRDLDAILVNPASIQETALEYMRSKLNNNALDNLTVSHPFPMLMEVCAHVGAAVVLRYDSMDPRHYAINAQTQEDLYRHMNDRQYIGRFALPANTKASMLFRLADLVARMVDDPDNGYKKIKIPRNSTFSVGGVDFLLPYPIEIRQVLDQTVQVVYDADEPSPIMSLTSNILDFEVGAVDMAERGYEEYLRINFDIAQTRIVTKKDKISTSSSLQIQVPFTDQYYMARVFYEDANKEWNEMYVTHADHIYNVTRPTAVLRVVDKNLFVTIPEIYTQTLGLTANVRVDLYETMGPLYMDLAPFNVTDWTATWAPKDKNDHDQYTAPLSNLQVMDVYSNAIVNGGRDALSLQELRDRVINGATGPQDLPITDPQIKAALIDRGYDIVTNVDLTTNRIFQASKALPQPRHEQLLSPASLSMQTLIVTPDEAVLTGSVVDNGNSITLTPNTIFQNVNDRVRIVPKVEVDQINALDPDRRAVRITQGNYFYTPFYYVLESQPEHFEMRAYYLDAPIAHSQFHLGANSTTRLVCALDKYILTRTPSGYRLRIVTRSDTAVKDLADSEIYAQLRFKPALETDSAYQLGTYVGRTEANERIFEFDLSTNYNVIRHGTESEDDSDSIELTKFQMYNISEQIVPALLTQKFEIIFATDIYMEPTWQKNQIDDMLGRFQLPLRIAAITVSSLTIDFGVALKRLWSRTRSLVGAERYAKYEFDVYKTYPEDVYEIFDNGTTIKVVNGQVVRNKLHSKGDYQLDPDTGEKIIEFHAGSVKQDSDYRPILLEPRRLSREIDLMLVEAAYWFSNDQVAIDYRQELASVIVDWIMNDLTDLQRRVLEQSKIFLYPKTTVGMIDVMFGAGLNTSIEAGQSLIATLSVDDNVASDERLITSLKKITIEVVTKHFKGDVVSISAILEELRSRYKLDVIDVRLEGLGGMANNFPVITVLSETERCSLGKRLVARPDGILVVEEDIIFNIVRHRKDKIAT